MTERDTLFFIEELQGKLVQLTEQMGRQEQKIRLLTDRVETLEVQTLKQTQDTIDTLLIIESLQHELDGVK